MLALVTGFVQELRRVGVPVSMVEAIDAMEALAVVSLSDRKQFRETLRSTLIKNARHDQAFDAMFDVFFATRTELPARVGELAGVEFTEPEQWAGSVAGDAESITETLLAALADGDLEKVRMLVREAVKRLAQIDGTRPVGATYYAFKTLRALDMDALERKLVEGFDAEADELVRQMLEAETRELMDFLRTEVGDEIRRRLVEERGVESLARREQHRLIEEVDIMHATKAELAQIEAIIEPLTRRLVARLARKRRQNRRGRLDFRRTMRAALGTGGVPLEPRFRAVRPHRPELFLLCDVSGSMATFARFALQFTYAMTTQFSKLRAFVFIDAIDEVTHILGPGVDFLEVIARIEEEADIVWLDGHSDYGTAFELFEERFGRDLTPRSTVILTGDARNNYREPRPGALAAISDRVQALYWLNPEPKAYWDTGDSVMARYSPMCDEVFEVMSLEQLEDFVERISAVRPGAKHTRTAPFKNGSNRHQTMPMLGGSPRSGGALIPNAKRPAAER